MEFFEGSAVISVQIFAVMLFTAVAMVWDIRTRRIPNWLNLIGLMMALIFCSATGGWKGVSFSVAGFMTGFAILLLLWLMGGAGGGDVKLMGAVGAWLGPYQTLIVFVASGFLTAAGQIAINMRRQFDSRKSQLLIEHSISNDGASNGSEQVRQTVSSSDRKRLPYAVPVAIAVWLVCGIKIVKFFSGA